MMLTHHGAHGKLKLFHLEDGGFNHQRDYKKIIHNINLDFIEREVNILKDEVAHLLETLVTDKDIERIEQRLEELEKMFYNLN
ncbi:MAG TPA: hypothetical protein LFV66_02530 [Rickettsia endosymbiont of Bembidion lapponicum]|nr:hypothetical protein [Rickettsia endosymbiont of Bembidion lapponicum]